MAFEFTVVPKFPKLLVFNVDPVLLLIVPPLMVTVPLEDNPPPIPVDLFPVILPPFI